MTTAGGTGAVAGEPAQDSGNVADLVAAAAARWPESIALLDIDPSDPGGTRGTAGAMTWAEFDQAVSARAHRLVETGLARGDRVVLRLPTSSAFAVTFFAIVRAGGVVVPVSPQAPAPEVDELLTDSGARLLAGHGSSERLPAGVRMVSTDGGEQGGHGGEFGAVGGGEDIALLSYTSGTTGPARGVLLSHRALLANVAQCAALPDGALTHADRVLLAIPLFHVYGLGPGLLQASSAGATTVLAQRFDAREALAACGQHRVTVIGGVPAMYREFAELPADQLGEGLSTVRLLTSGAAPLHPTVLAAIRHATGLGVYEGYGLTETGPVLTSTLVTGYPKPGSVGRAIPGVELRLVGSDGDADPIPLDPQDPDDAFDEDAGGTGLVSVRGANLFSGYWPDGAHGPDSEGWFRTGDVGYLDNDGDLHLVDRANDLIIVNGFNVFPHEIEEIVRALPGVAEVAAFGVLDERTGEAVKVILVPTSSAALSSQQVIEHCAQRLAGYKVPYTVEFADELPHSPTGKLRRVRLRTAQREE